MSKSKVKFEDYQARQGDVGLFELEKFDLKDYEQITKEEDKDVLALGEATGHHHHVMPKNSIMLRHKETGNVVLMVLKSTELRHEEHSIIPLTKRPMEVIIQQQWDYTSDLIVPVVD